jgi:sarcosine/dimethylglycine N-methyltransferase
MVGEVLAGSTEYPCSVSFVVRADIGRERRRRLPENATSMKNHSGTADVAAYYDGEIITRFYQELWGGADIHIGLYETGHETIAQASDAMTRRLLRLAGARSGQDALDIACGYGGTLRILAEIGCRVHGIDISSACLARTRRLNAEAGYGNDIDVAYGDFCDIAFPDRSMDLVVCQESIIHAVDRPKVFSEVYRVVRHGGTFAFSDIVSSKTAERATIAAAFSRLGEITGATAEHYRSMALAAGFEVEFMEERPSDIATHYDKLADQLQKPTRRGDPAFDPIRESISNWQRALAAGDITWMCAIARKPVREQRQSWNGFRRND